MSKLYKMMSEIIKAINDTKRAIYLDIISKFSELINFPMIINGSPIKGKKVSMLNNGKFVIILINHKSYQQKTQANKHGECIMINKTSLDFTYISRHINN